jgi:hypothetical protein
MENSLPDVETHHLICACSDAEHDLRVVYDPHDGHIIFEVQLNPSWRPWYQRIWTALRYVFGSRVQCKYGAYDCTILRRQDYHVLRELMYKSENCIDNVDQKG